MMGDEYSSISSKLERLEARLSVLRMGLASSITARRLIVEIRPKFVTFFPVVSHRIEMSGPVCHEPMDILPMPSDFLGARLALSSEDATYRWSMSYGHQVAQQFLFMRNHNGLISLHSPLLWFSSYKPNVMLAIGNRPDDGCSISIQSKQVPKSSISFMLGENSSIVLKISRKKKVMK